MGDAPGVRAGWPKLAIRHIKLLPGPSSQAILARIHEPRERARAATFRDFVSLEDFVAIADATLLELGLVETRTLWHNVMLESLSQPAVGELVRRAGNVTHTPVPLLERTADAFYFVHRNAGSWVVSGGDARATITLEDAPPQVAESQAMHAVYWGNVRSVLTKLGIQGTVSVTAEPAARRIRYQVRWQTPDNSEA